MGPESNVSFLKDRKEDTEDFPGGPVVRSLPANAGDTGSIPGLGRSHMMWGSVACGPQPLKPLHLEPVLRNKRSHRDEKPANHKEQPSLENA